MPLAPSQRPLEEDSSLPFWAGSKLGEVDKALRWTLLQEDTACPSRVLLDIEAAKALMPVLVPVPAGQIASGDGHMIAYGAQVAMHKGKSTRLGRTMAGSPAVIAHTAAGHALWMAYHPPARHLSQGIVESGQEVAMATGTSRCVHRDRAIHAVALAVACDAQDLGWLCMLDANEPQGLESFAATLGGALDDGTAVSNGVWQVLRPDEPRPVVIVLPAEGTT